MADPMNIFKKIKESLKQFHAHKFDYLNKTDQFLERYKLPKLTQGETDNLNRPVSVKEID